MIVAKKFAGGTPPLPPFPDFFNLAAPLPPFLLPFLPLSLEYRALARAFQLPSRSFWQQGMTATWAPCRCAMAATSQLRCEHA